MSKASTFVSINRKSEFISYFLQDMDYKFTTRILIDWWTGLALNKNTRNNDNNKRNNKRIILHKENKTVSANIYYGQRITCSAIMNNNNFKTL